MDSAEAVAAKRRVLIDALMMCLQKSRVSQVVDVETVRGVVNSAAGDLWRQGEFRLEPVWKMLVSQPGLSAEEVAPPLLVFKAYEGELGVLVRVPQALSAIPRGEQVRLRETLGIGREDFQRAIEEMRTIVDDEQKGKSLASVVDEASGKTAATAAAAKGAAAKSAAARNAAAKGAAGTGKDKPDRRGLAIGLASLAVVALGVSAWLTLRDPSKSFDLSDTAPVLQLSDGRAVGPSLTATIADPKWESMSKDERKNVASRLMDLESHKGIRALMLVDPGGATRAIVTEPPAGRSVIVY